MKFTPEKIADLSSKVDAYIDLVIGESLPHVILIVTPDPEGLAFFTNRRDNDEVEQILEAALEALRGQGDRFVAIDGRLE